MSASEAPSDVTIVPLSSAAQADECAEMMSTTDPWLTLGGTREKARAGITNPQFETYVALRGGRVVGFVVVCMQGAFIGYIRTVCVAADSRGQGLGSRLIAFAEKRILAVTPNVFMCVSSFNTSAKRLYLRLGYEVVGELRDYIVAGHSELLLRKTIGPLSGASARH